MTEVQATARAWIDGAARGNPGAAGFGVLLEHSAGKERVVGALGETTNNVAEYSALIAVLLLAGRLGIDRLTVHSDSQLLVRQLEGVYRVKAVHLKPLYERAVTLRKTFARVELRHVRREHNKEADRLANLAIDRNEPCPSWLDLGVPTQSQ